ncbi:MAG: hypothetical protein RLZ75_659 [Pseudomonadota bacterium]|jgi:hypothetical protein
MLALEIDNPEIELIFQTKFNGNKNKFINFIQDSLKNLENINNDEFQFKKLNPKQNAYRMTSVAENETLSNPFENIEDVLSYAQSLREKAYR